MADKDTGFYAAIAPFDEFARVVDPKVYHPVPDDWAVGLTDVAGSTRAIEAGRYKHVNMAGAAAISAVMNALGHRDFPFVFGGDGTSFAVPPEGSAAAAEALARTARWVEDELGLDLRVAMAPVREIRAAGHDLRVARFAASGEVSYAMFSGGGAEWAETEMKAGRFALEPAPPGAHPDLTGLSCRWTPIESRRGAILSVLVTPAGDAATNRKNATAFRKVVREIVALVGRFERGGHPVPPRGPGFKWPPAGLELEARASKGDKPLGKQKRLIRLITLIAWVLDKTGWKVGGFDPTAYRVNTSLNTDFRKFDDALRMTVDCDDATIAEIEAVLERAREQGAIRYGLYRQDAALMTCIVPSVLSHDHMHFLDGAGGGYASASVGLKAMK